MKNLVIRYRKWRITRLKAQLRAQKLALASTIEK
jgi:hypothetical protein